MKIMKKIGLLEAPVKGASLCAMGDSQGGESRFSLLSASISFAERSIKTKKRFPGGIAVGLLFGAILFLTACAVKLPPVSTYVLTLPPVTSGPIVHPKTSYVLLVNQMTADPGYDSSQMIYVKTPAHLQPYAYNQWVAPPAQMFMPLIVGRIESKHYFRAVVLSPFSGATNYRLDTRLLILQQEFMHPVSEVRCVVRAVLVDTKTNRVIASRNFQAVVPAPGNNPESGVGAANLAARQVADQIAVFVSMLKK